MKKLPTLFNPLPIAILSFLIVTSFFRYYLYVSSTQQLREFKNQNFKELYSMDTFRLSSKLNSLSSVINWVCIEGNISQRSFYKMEKGECKTSLIQQTQTIEIPQANNIAISFTTRLPLEVEKLFLVFFIFQIILIIALITSTRRSEALKKLSEVKLSKLARQMSHDIRSPLATLNTILSDIDTIPEEEKNLLNLSIVRINDIANNLLFNTRSHSQDFFHSDLLPQIKDNKLSDLILESVDEKKYEYNKFKNIIINLLESNVELYASIDASEFKRIFSNLVNNSIESSIENSVVIINVNLFLKNDHAVISINDNGQGIPNHILNKIGMQEITTKKEGNGIGLFHAIESIKSWGGDMKIQSKPLEGTQIEIILPLSRKLAQAITILLDDDELVRLTWKSQASKKKINFKSFENSEEMISLLETFSKESVFYLDSQLKNGQKGEDVAKVLFDKGFINIYMASGFEKDHFTNLHFIKGVINKSPPWK